MTELGVGLATALWLGLLTSISPCPLATNVAAMTYIGRRIEKPGLVVMNGLVYTIGRVAAYLILGVLLIAGLLAAPAVSHALQTWVGKLVGPLLILIGMVLLGLLTVPIGELAMLERIRVRAETAGIVGTGVIGMVFALSFCPISAALFFGSLVPLAVRLDSRVLIPTAYGIGTGLPVFGFALLLAMGTERVARAFRVLSSASRWARCATGVVFIVIGVYETLRSIYGVV